MSSGYSEEDIRRAAEIREWLIKEISDRQEEVERLRTTLSIIDNLLKQGSFRAAANLGLGASAATSAPAGPTTAATATTAQVQQQNRQAEAFLEAFEELQDLGLDGHVERRRRLVGDQQRRFQREAHRDHRPLAHAARELVRV